MNDDIEIEVNSTEALKYISYQVLGRGDILYASSVQIPNPNRNTISFR